MHPPEGFRSPRHDRSIEIADWGDAEELGKWHMIHLLGISDAELTNPGNDAGLDVTAESTGAQVKHQVGAVGAPDVQRLQGAAHNKAFRAFYSLGGYTAAAMAYADQADVALFRYNVYGDVMSLNLAAHHLVDTAPARSQEIEASRTLRRDELRAERIRESKIYRGVSAFWMEMRADGEASADADDIAQTLQAAIKNCIMRMNQDLTMARALIAALEAEGEQPYSEVEPRIAPAILALHALEAPIAREVYLPHDIPFCIARVDEVLKRCAEFEDVLESELPRLGLVGSFRFELNSSDGWTKAWSLGEGFDKHLHELAARGFQPRARFWE